MAILTLAWVRASMLTATIAVPDLRNKSSQMAIGHVVNATMISATNVNQCD